MIYTAKNELDILIWNGIMAVKNTRIEIPYSSNTGPRWGTDLQSNLLLSAIRSRKSPPREMFLEHPELIKTLDKKDLPSHIIFFNEIRNSLADKRKHKDKTRIPDLQMYLTIKEAKLSVRGKMGNCGETSVHAFLYLIKNMSTLDPNIDHLESQNVDISGDNHAFVVINRSPGTDLTKISSWNFEAIIVDPWFTLSNGINPCVFINQDDYKYCPPGLEDKANSCEDRGKNSKQYNISESYQMICRGIIKSIQGGSRTSLFQNYNSILAHIQRRSEQKKRPAQEQTTISRSPKRRKS